jgi:hypothetical protein
MSSWCIALQVCSCSSLRFELRSNARSTFSWSDHRHAFPGKIGAFPWAKAQRTMVANLGLIGLEDP